MTQFKCLCNKLIATQFILSSGFLTVIGYIASNGRTISENLENECNEVEVICIKFVSKLVRGGGGKDAVR
jgi:hypothetical protein